MYMSLYVMIISFIVVNNVDSAASKCWWDEPITDFISRLLSKTNILFQSHI